MERIIFSYDDTVSTGVEAFHIKTYKNNDGYIAYISEAIYGKEILLTIKKGVSCVFFNGKLVAKNQSGYEIYGNAGDTIVIVDNNTEVIFTICTVEELAKAVNNL